MEDPNKLIAMVDAALAGTAIPVGGKPVRPKPRRPEYSRWDDPKTRERLEAARVRTYFGGPGRTLCSKPGCKNTIVRDHAHCWPHLSGPEKGALRRKREREGRLVPSKPAAARRIIQRMMLGGLLPPGLLTDATFCGVMAARRAKGSKEPYDKRSFGDVSWNQAVYLLAAELIRGYAVRESSGDWGPWTETVRKARSMGIIQ